MPLRFSARRSRLVSATFFGRLRCFARLWGGAPHEHGSCSIDLVVRHHALGEGRVVELDGRRLLVGGDQHTLQPALGALAVGCDDVAKSQRHRLADRLLEMNRRAQAALETGARDLQRVVPAHGVLVVELATDQSRREGDGFHVEALFDTGGPVDGHAQRATTELEVVQVELQVGDDGDDQTLDLLQCVGVAHLVLPPVSLASRRLWLAPDIGPISKEGVDPEEPTPSVHRTSKDRSSISAGG